MVRLVTAAVRMTPHRRAGPVPAVGGGDGVQRGLQHVPGDRGDVRVGAVQVRLAGPDRQVRVERQRLPVAGHQRVAQSVGERRGPGREPVRRQDHVGAQRPQRLFGEAAYVRGGAEGGAHLVELAGHLFGMDGGLPVLGEELAFLLGGGLPLPVQVVAALEADIEGELLRLRVAQQQPLEDRLDHVVGPVRHRDGDAQGLADLLVLAEQHVQDDPVDAVVRPVDRDGAHDARVLPEPVDAALPLLVPGRVPGQVVVDDGLEVLLQVHALGQAVGRHQHRPPGRISR